MLRLVSRHPQGVRRGAVACEARREGVPAESGRLYRRVQLLAALALVAACDRLGIETRRMNAVTISVAKRRSVALLDDFIGPKR